MNPWDDAHAAAEATGADTYVDPVTGFMVLTAGFLTRRGRCCGSGCRHCPYGYEAVPEPRRSRLIAERGSR